MNPKSILHPVFSTRTARDDQAERQSVYLAAWAQNTDDKCGRETTIKLLESALERARKRAASGE
jgi:hypothetical protein